MAVNDVHGERMTFARRRTGSGVLYFEPDIGDSTALCEMLDASGHNLQNPFGGVLRVLSEPLKWLKKIHVIQRHLEHTSSPSPVSTENILLNWTEHIQTITCKCMPHKEWAIF